MTDEVSELSRPRAKVASFGDGAEDAPGSVATVERSRVSDPVDLDTMQLQSEEYHKGGNGNTAGECGDGEAETERGVRSVKLNGRGGSAY